MAAKYPIHSNLENKTDYLTRKQWLNKGFVPVSDEKIVQMYSNGFRQKVFEYINKNDVRRATEKEILSYKENKKKTGKYLQKKTESEKKKKIKEFRKLCLNKSPAVQVNPANTLVIDIETTGLNIDEDEILKISILNLDTKKIIFNKFSKPFLKKNWHDAEKINHISPRTVAHSPFIYELLPEVNSILASAKMIVGYNIDFDISFLKTYGFFIPDVEIYDVMTHFSEIYGEYSEKYGEYKWQKLTTCAEYYNYNWGADKAHDSLADCKATAYCFNKMKRRK